MTSVCSRMVWLDSGLIKASGDPSEVVAAYTANLKK
jgi:ABC-type polysaccharide/polyol phosphate transport system ATPase subunit